MLQTQVSLGPMTINTYTLTIALGALIGGLWALWPARRSWQELSRAVNGLLLVALGGLALGRTGYVLLNGDYFREHMDEVLSLASPGYCEQAAIIGGLAGWAISRRLRQAITAPALVVLATLIGIGASLGCVSHGCAYGREVFWTDGWLWQLRADWPDAYTINNPRLPTQLFMLAWLVACLAITRWRGRAGGMRIAGLWLVLFAVGDFSIEFLRIDATPILGSLRAGQWADIVLMVTGILALILRMRPLYVKPGQVNSWLW